MCVSLKRFVTANTFLFVRPLPTDYQVKEIVLPEINKAVFI